MKTVRDFKVLVFDENHKLIHSSIHKNVFDEEKGMFDHERIKRQVYDSRGLSKYDFVMYGRDMKIIALRINNEVHELQGMKDWANVKTYIEKGEDGCLYLRVKNLVHRYKDIERNHFKKLERTKIER